MDNYRLIMQVGPDSWILTAWQRLGQDEVNVKQLQEKDLWHIFFSYFNPRMAWDHLKIFS